jgi:hypothetical protein
MGLGGAVKRAPFTADISQFRIQAKGKTQCIPLITNKAKAQDTLQQKLLPNYDMGDY